MKPGTRVTILWLDASYSTDETSEPGKVEPTVHADQLTATAGFFVAEDQESIAIAHEWYPWSNPGTCRGIYRIPRSMLVWVDEERAVRREKRNKSFRPPKRTV